MSRRISFRLMRKPEDGNLPKGFPFWIGTFVGSFFVIFVFLIALADINRAVRTHSSTIDFLNLSVIKGNVLRPPQTRFDLSSPRLSFTAPLPDKTFSGKVPIVVSVSDPRGGIAAVKLFIDNEDARELLPPYRFEWDTASVADGEHIIRVVAQDTAGNEASVVNRITVDN